MAASQLCQRCATEQRPESYVVSLGGSCCKCGVGAKEKSRCGECGNGGSHCAQCDEFNGYFELKRSDSDCCLYEYEFPKDDQGKTPCGATKIQMRLRPHQDEDKVNVCVGIVFDQSQGAVRPVSWGKTKVGDCCQIGVLRRSTANSKCCWPQQITVTPMPVPDCVVPEPEWAISDPDDLNDAPYWPKMDVDLMEDSDGVPVRYFNGELQLRRKDLGSDGFGIPWGHTRIYSNRLSNSFDFGNGFNWLIHESPRLVRLKSNPKDLEKFSPWMLPPKPHEPTGCTIVLLRGTRNSLWFDQYKDPQDSKKFKWLPRFGAKHTLTHDDTKDMIFTLATPNGQLWYFYDFTPPSGKSLQSLSKAERDKRSPGCLKQHVSSGGQKFDFEYKGCKLQSATREYKQTQAPHEYAHETFEYTYYDDAGAAPCKCQQDDPNKGRLCSVLLKRKDANGTKTNVRRVQFVYYANKQKEKNHGNVGDLKLAVVQAPGQNAWRNLAVDYYRYHTKAYDTYCQGMLKYFVGPEAFRRIVRKAKSMNPPAPDADIAPELLWIADHSVDHLSNLMDTVMESTVQEFADLHVEYHEADRRVKEITIAGGDHKRTFTYEKDEQADDTEKSEFNKGKWITTETRPAYGGEVTVHSNLAGQATRFQLKDEDGRVFHRRLRFDCLPGDAASRIPSLLLLHEPSMLDGQGQVKNTGLGHSFEYSEEYPASRYLTLLSVLDNGTPTKVRAYAYKKNNPPGWQMAAVREMRLFKATAEYALPQPPAPPVTLGPSPPPPSGPTTSNDIVIRYSCTFTKPRLEARSTTFLDVPQSQNGLAQFATPPSGKSKTDETFDDHGNLSKFKDLRGAETRIHFHAATGAPKSIFVEYGAPNGPLTSFKSDQLGRVTQILGPPHDAVADPNTGATVNVRTATWYVYKDISGQVWTAHGHVAGQVETQINPVQIDRMDRAGRVTETVLAVRTQQGRPSPQETMLPQQSWGGWASHQFDDKSRLVQSRVYHHIPASGTGSVNANYDVSQVEYDEMRLPRLTISPGGMQSEVEYSARGLVKRVKTGVASTFLSVENFYDGEHNDPTATGNGVLTMQVRHLGGGAVHMAEFQHDSRDRQVYSRFANGRLNAAGQPVPDHPVSEYGRRYTNQNQVFEETTGQLSASLGVRTINLIDVRGRVYRTLHEGYGTTGYLTPLVDNIWYNDAGDVLRYQPHGGDVFVRSEYDKLGRELRRFVATDAFTASQAKSAFHAESPNTINPISASHSEVAHEIVTNSWDDAGNLRVVVNQYRGPQPAAGSPSYRTEGVGFSYDSLGRLLLTADIGAQSPVPITTQTRFDKLGNPFFSLDPLGRKTVRAFDHAQRVVSVTENSGGGAPGGRTTEFTYSPDGPITRIVYRPPGRNAQVTEYEFDDPFVGHLPSAIRYPGSVGMNDAERFEYNLLGEVTKYTDRNGTVHTFDYDQLRRPKFDKIDTFGVDVDQSISEITYEYDPLTEGIGNVLSFGPASGGGGREEKNLVGRLYNGRQQVSAEHQYHNKPNGGRTNFVKVSYRYADGADNHVRLFSIDHPELFASQGFGHDDLGRVTDVTAYFSSVAGSLHSIDTIARYSYWGADRLYATSYLPTDPQDVVVPVSSALDYQPPPTFSQVDAFDRRTSLIWSKGPNGSTVLERLAHQYTKNSLRQYRQDVQAGSKHRDQLYKYDGLDRLELMKRGKLNLPNSGPSIQQQNLQQTWQLDGADNWDKHFQVPTETTWGWQWQVQERVHDDGNRLRSVKRRADEVVQVRISGTAPTSGNFTLTVNNQTTANIAYNASAATVQTRLKALSSIGPNNVDCFGGPLPGQAVYVRFVGALANQDIGTMTAANVDLNAGTPKVARMIEGGLRDITASHDANGNMTTVPDLFYDKQVQCIYDAWNRLVSVKHDGDEIVRYGYDGLHRRITKAIPGSPTRHYFHSVDNQVLFERLTSPSTGSTDPRDVRTDRRYFWGIRGLDDLIVRDWHSPLIDEIGLNERHFVLQDDNFNVTALTDTSGNVVERFTYDPYGQFEIYDANYQPRTGSQYDWDILYGGYRFDWESWLYHVRRRQFSPTLGRWLQADPASYEDRYNLYQYCFSSPPNVIDPTGETGILDRLFGYQGLVRDVGADPGWMGQFYRGFGESLAETVGPEYFAQAGDLELIGLTTAAVTAGVLTGGAVWGAGGGLILSGAAAGGAEYLAWTLGAQAFSGGAARGPTVSGLATNVVAGAITGGILQGAGIAARSSLRALPWLGRRVGRQFAFGTKGRARLGRGRGFGRAKVRPGDLGTTYATPQYERYQHWLLRLIPGLRKVTYTNFSYGVLRRLPDVVERGVRRHELAHVALMRRFPQIPHLAGRRGYWPGKGVASTIMELHGNIARFGRNIPAALWQTLSDVNHLALAGDIAAIYGVYRIHQMLDIEE